MIEQLPSTGVYALVLEVPLATTLVIGRLGRRELHAGFYVYVGSALNSLPKRIARHLRKSKKTHWHIDYLLGKSMIQVLIVGWRPTIRRIECRLARNIRKHSVARVKGFGCGDCHCDSHLHYFPRLESAEAALSRAGLHLVKVSHET